MFMVYRYMFWIVLGWIINQLRSALHSFTQFEPRKDSDIEAMILKLPRDKQDSSCSRGGCWKKHVSQMLAVRFHPHA